MTPKYEANSKKEAWTIVDELFPTDYTEDTAASEQAGYTIYKSNIDANDYICDLGDRLEVNLKNGKTINVWIVEPKKEQPTRTTEITKYKSCKYAKGGMRPEELKKLAQQIFANGTITDTCHHIYQTTDPAVTHGDDELVSVFNGRVSYAVECNGLPIKYIIHMHALEVTEIIEEIVKGA